MKKISIFALVLLIALFAVSCGSTPTGRPGGTGGSSSVTAWQESGLPDIVRNARRNAPEGTLVGIGSARLASQSQSKTLAETRARAEIARAMDSMVQDMVIDYQASSEVDPAAAISFQESITRTLSGARLSGAAISDEDVVNGTYYVVMYLSKADVVREITAAQSAARLNVPAMAAFNALDRMEAAYDKALTQELQVNDR